MLRLLSIVLSAVMLGGLGSSVEANGVPFNPNFKPQPQPFPGMQFQPMQVLRAGVQETRFTVVLDNKAKEPRLQVPANMLLNFQMQPGAGGFPGGPPGGVRPGAGGFGAPGIIGGLCLSLALATGGVSYVRRRGARVAAGVIVVLFGLGSASLWADLAPPIGPRPQPFNPQPVNPQPFGLVDNKLPPVTLPADLRLPGKMQLEVVGRGDSVRLIINPSMLTRNANGGATSSR